MNTKKENILLETDQLLQSIKEGKEEALKEMYRQFREEFLNWACGHFAVSRDEAADIFQDAIIVFYRHVVRGKLKHLHSSVKTYLFGIGKNMLMKVSQKKNKTVSMEDLPDFLFEKQDLTVFHEIELNHRQKLILEIVNQLSDVCQKIIDLFYYRRFSMEAISETMGYENEGVARSMKLKCKKRFIDIARDKFVDLF